MAVIISILALVGMATSCHRVERPHKYGEITLHAMVDNIPSTKGEGPLGSSYNQNLTLGFARVDESEESGWSSFAGASEMLQAIMSPGAEGNTNFRDIEFTTYQTFRNSTSEIRYASWYPYIENSLSNGVVTFDDIDGSTDIMYGSVARGHQTSGFNTIVYQHALVKYTLRLYAMVQTNENGDVIHDSRGSWGRILDVKIKSLPNDVRLSLPTDNDYTLDYSSQADFALTKSGANLLDELPVGITSASSHDPIMAPPPVGNNLTIEVTTQRDDQPTPQTRSITITRNFLIGKNYTIYLRFSDNGLINPEIKVGEWVERGTISTIDPNATYYNLSANQHANCYIVSSANYGYCFDVTVRGNGEEGVVDGINTNINPTYIDTIWVEKSLKSGFRMEKKPQNGKFFFEIRGNANDPSDHTLTAKGNILVAAYDKAPSEGGVVLWTWHIWVTDKPAELSLRNGFSTLDRDIGAISASSSTDYLNNNPTHYDGLYYQWGRPTPFPFGKTLTKGFTPTVAHNQVNMSERSLNPTLFYNQRPGSQNTTSLWGYRKETQEYSKTVYDPCPPGYRVPSYKLSHNMDVELKHINHENHHIIHYSAETNHDMFFPINGYYYPEGDLIKRNGYLLQGSSDADDFGSYIWLATTVKDGSYYEPYLLDISVSPDGLGEYKVTEVITTNRPGYPATYAMPVRCVSRRSHAEIKDLSSAQTANSYIVSEAGFYKFKATVRGNGIGKLVSAGTAGSIDISEGLSTDITSELVRVDYLWWQGDLSSTGNNGDPDTPANKIPVTLENGGNVDSNGYLHFQIDKWRKGNLILAGYNARGEIIWSWHLWLTDEPANHNSHDYAVMDRFLGATSAPAFDLNSSPEPLPTLGFFYQWGRKDPFPGPASMSTTSGTTSTWWRYDGSTWSQKVSFDQTTSTPSQKSVANSILTPTRYHLSEDDNIFTTGNTIPLTLGNQIDNNDNALKNQCYSTMVNSQTLNSFWGYSSASGFGKTSTKTMYDPCPPGYSVAYYLVWTHSDKYQSDFSRMYTSLDEGYKSHSNSKYVTEPAGGGGIFLTNGNDGMFSNTWYPYTGYIDCHLGEFKKVGTEGRFHSSTPGGNGSRSLFYIDQNTSTNNSNVYTGQAIGSNYVGLPSTYGYPVRCQKE